MFGFRKLSAGASSYSSPPCCSVCQEIIEVESENVFKLAANALQVGVFKCIICTVCYLLHVKFF